MLAISCATCLALLLGTCSLAAPINGTGDSGSATTRHEALRPRDTPACKRVADALRRSSGTTAAYGVVENAQDAYNCMISIPLDITTVDGTIDSILRLLPMEATLPYLEDTAVAAQFDFAAVQTPYKEQIEAVRQTANTNGYANQFAFEQAIENVFRQARDANFIWQGALAALFRFRRDSSLQLVCIAEAAGRNVIRLYSDLGTSNTREVTQIDGVSVLEFLKQQADEILMRDMQTRWNELFARGREGGMFIRIHGFTGQPTTKLTFDNGETMEKANFAFVQDPELWDSVQDASNVYDIFIRKTDFDDVHMTDDVSTRNRGPVPLSWRFVTDPGDDDNEEPDWMGILTIKSFDESDINGWDRALGEFFNICATMYVEHLIIDLRGTVGDSYEQVAHAFRQFFPDIVDVPPHRFRSNAATDLIGKAISMDPPPAAGTRPTTGLFRFQNMELMTFNGDYNLYDTEVPTSWDQVSTSPSPELDDSKGGYSHMYSYDADPHEYVDNQVQSLFEAENIILLSDGTCVEACALFLAMMTSPAVNSRTVAVAAGYYPIDGRGEAPAASSSSSSSSSDADGSEEEEEEEDAEPPHPGTFSLAGGSRTIHALSLEALVALTTETRARMLVSGSSASAVQTATAILPVLPPIQYGRATINYNNVYRSHDARVPYAFSDVQLVPWIEPDCVLLYDADTLADPSGRKLFERIFDVAIGGDGPAGWTVDECVAGIQTMVNANDM